MGLNPTDHEILHILDVIDGDSLIVHMEHVVGFSEDVQNVNRRFDVRLRLINLDTPERSNPRYIAARQELEEWLYGGDSDLRVRTYGRDSFGRFLADIYGPDGATATQYMLQRGWEPYVRKGRK